MKRGYAPGILAVILFLLLFPVDCQAEIAGDQAFNHLTWEMILEDQPMGENRNCAVYLCNRRLYYLY